MNIKLRAEYDNVSKHVVACITEDNLLAHVNRIISSADYKNLTTRVANDIKCVTVPSYEVCRWYNEYDCNDDHVTTLFKTIIKNHYPKVWAILQEN